MTLIEVRNSSGLVGRCDAKCYNATHSECHCICGGVNHGCGKDKAIDNTKEFVAKQVKGAYSKKKGSKVVISENCIQMELF